MRLRRITTTDRVFVVRHVATSKYGAPATATVVYRRTRRRHSTFHETFHKYDVNTPPTGVQT